MAKQPLQILSWGKTATVSRELMREWAEADAPGEWDKEKDPKKRLELGMRGYHRMILKAAAAAKGHKGEVRLPGEKISKRLDD